MPASLKALSAALKPGVSPTTSSIPTPGKSIRPPQPGPRVEPGIKRHNSGNGVDEMIGQTAARPSVWVRETAIEPEARRFHCAAGEDYHLCFFGDNFAGHSDAPCDAARDRLCVGVDTHRECIRQQRDRPTSARPLNARESHRDVADRRGTLGL